MQIKINNASFGYNGENLLEDFSFEVNMESSFESSLIFFDNLIKKMIPIVPTMASNMMKTR